MGPPMVIEAGLFEPEKEPVPLPVQLVKLKSLAGMALIEIAVPRFFHPLMGLTVPPVSWVIVR